MKCLKISKLGNFFYLFCFSPNKRPAKKTTFANGISTKLQKGERKPERISIFIFKLNCGADVWPRKPKSTEVGELLAHDKFHFGLSFAFAAITFRFLLCILEINSPSTCLFWRSAAAQLLRVRPVSLETRLHFVHFQCFPTPEQQAADTSEKRFRQIVKKSFS